VLCSRPDSSRR